MIQVTINGEDVTKYIKVTSFRILDAVNNRSTCEFTFLDADNNRNYTKGVPVQVNADDGMLFSGFIDSASYTKLGRGRNINIKCADMHYLGDKRVIAKSYKAVTAGSIVRDILAQKLKDEGVRGFDILQEFNHAIDWNTGEFVGVLSSDAGIALAKSGADLSRLFTVTADFASASQATFTRNSNAYDSTGKLYSKNQPRIETGKGLRIEESTTNVCTNPFFNGYTGSGIPSGYGKWDDTPVFASSNDPNYAPYGTAVHVTTTVASTGLYYNLIGLTAGTVYSFTWYIYVVSGTICANTYQQTVDAGLKLSSGTGLQKLTGTFTALGTGGSVFVYSSNATTDYYVAALQLEALPYNTSITNGVRANEVPTIPTSNIMSASQGTFECIVNFNSVMSLPRISNAFPTIFESRPVNDSQDLMRAYISTGTGGNGKQVQFSVVAHDGTSFQCGHDAHLSDGDHRVTLRWMTGEICIFVDGVKATLPVLLTSMPTQVHPNLSIGSSYGNSLCFLNGCIRDIVISSIARADADLVTRGVVTPLGVDAYTTCYMPLTSNIANVCAEYLDADMSNAGDQVTMGKYGTDYSKTYSSAADWTSGTKTNIYGYANFLSIASGLDISHSESTNGDFTSGTPYHVTITGATVCPAIQNVYYNASAIQTQYNWGGNTKSKSSWANTTANAWYDSFDDNSVASGYTCVHGITVDEGASGLHISDSAGNSDPEALVITGVGASGDNEICAKLMTTGGFGRMGVGLRTDSSTGVGWKCYTSGGNLIQILHDLNHFIAQNITVPFTFYANTWYWFRFRNVGTNLYAKVWQDGTNEPNGWSWTGSDGSVPSGAYASIGVHGQSTPDSSVQIYCRCLYINGSYNGGMGGSSYFQMAMPSYAIRTATVDWVGTTTYGTSQALYGSLDGTNWTYLAGAPATGISLQIAQGYNLSGKTLYLRWDNYSPTYEYYGVMATITGLTVSVNCNYADATWTMHTLDISSAHIITASNINWTESDESGTSVTLQVSYDGSNWYSCTKNSTIPQLTNGTDCTGKTLYVKATFNGGNAYRATLTGITISLTTGRYTSGSWVSPAIDLSGTNRCMVSTVTTAITQGTGTSVTVSYSKDNGSTWTVIAGGSGSALALLTDTSAITQFKLKIDMTGTTSSSPYVTSIAVSVPTAYKTSGYWQNVIALDTVGLALSKTLAWTRSIPANTAMTVQASIDAVNWTTLSTNTGSDITCVPSLSSLAGKKLYLKVYCTSDGSATPTLNDITVTMPTAYNLTASWLGTIDIRDVGVAATTLLTYTVNAPANSTVTVETSLDNATWTPMASSPLALPQISEGDDVSDYDVYVRVSMTSNGAVQPSMSYLKLEATNGSIMDGITLDEAVFNYCTCSRAIDRLAQRCGYWWCITATRVMYFMPVNQIQSGWGTLTLEDVRNSSVSVVNGNTKYVNTQYVKGAYDITTQQSQTLTCDGKTTSWALAYPLNSEPVVKIGSTVQTMGVKGTGVSQKFYWMKSDPVIYYNGAATDLPSGTVLTVTYYGEFPIVVMSSDSGEIYGRQAIEGVGSGIVEGVTEDQSLNTRDASYQLAANLLGTNGKIGNTVTVETYCRGLYAGEYVTVQLPKYDIDESDMLIQQVETTISSGKVKYKATVTENHPDDWTNMFQTLADKSLSIRENISENEVLVQTFSQGDTWTWTDSFISSSVPTVYPSDTTYPSDTIYPSG